MIRYAFAAAMVALLLTSFPQVAAGWGLAFGLFRWGMAICREGGSQVGQ